MEEEKILGSICRDRLGGLVGFTAAGSHCCWCKQNGKGCKLAMDKIAVKNHFSNHKSKGELIDVNVLVSQEEMGELFRDMEPLLRKHQEEEGCFTCKTIADRRVTEHNECDTCDYVASTNKKARVAQHHASKRCIGKTLVMCPCDFGGLDSQNSQSEVCVV